MFLLVSCQEIAQRLNCDHLSAPAHLDCRQGSASGATSRSVCLPIFREFRLRVDCLHQSRPQDVPRPIGRGVNSFVLILPRCPDIILNSSGLRTSVQAVYTPAVRSSTPIRWSRSRSRRQPGAVSPFIFRWASSGLTPSSGASCTMPAIFSIHLPRSVRVLSPAHPAT